MLGKPLQMRIVCDLPISDWIFSCIMHLPFLVCKSYLKEHIARFVSKEWHATFLLKFPHYLFNVLNNPPDHSMKRDSRSGSTDCLYQNHLGRFINYREDPSNQNCWSTDIWDFKNSQCKGCLGGPVS